MIKDPGERRRRTSSVRAGLILLDVLVVVLALAVTGVLRNMVNRVGVDGRPLHAWTCSQFAAAASTAQTRLSAFYSVAIGLPEDQVRSALTDICAGRPGRPTRLDEAAWAISQ